MRSLNLDLEIPVECSSWLQAHEESGAADVGHPSADTSAIVYLSFLCSPYTLLPTMRLRKGILRSAIDRKKWSCYIIAPAFDGRDAI